MSRHRSLSVGRALILVWAAVGMFGLVGSAQGPGQSSGAGPIVSPQLRARLASQGRARVIVQLKLPAGVHVAEGRFANRGAILGQRQAIASARSRVLARAMPANARVLRQYATVPYVVLDLPAGALAALEADTDDIVSITEDTLLRATLGSSVPHIQGDQAWDGGYDGAGTTVAILDSGVDANHPFLGGRVVAEACYSSTVAGTTQSLCPNGLDVQVGAGAAAPCDRSECGHGTHVTGIAAGNGALAGQPFSGVARNADVLAVQVFSEVIDAAECGGVAPCLGAFTSDVIAGLEHVYAVAVAGQHNIAAVNMSLGGGAFSAPCDAEPYKPAIDNLRAIGIASVVASGNGFEVSQISSPACVSSAVSVGSTTLTDEVSWFSSVSPFLSLLAPGDGIASSTLFGNYEVSSGTSMAAPHVTGAFAVIKQGAPEATVDEILLALQSTGVPVTDTRFWAPGTTTVNRIKVFEALATLAAVTSPVPSITAVTPTDVRAGADVEFTVTGSGFNAFSVAEWDGVPVTTTTVSTTELHASVSAAALVVGSSQLTVSNPAPGGGTSEAFPLVVGPPALLTVDAATVAPGSTVTVTLENGFGGTQDWLSVAASEAPNSGYVTWTYVGAGVLTRTWTVTLPSTAGDYEFRLFRDNGFVRSATSAPVTVDPAYAPAPKVTSLLPVSGAAGGQDLTLTVIGSGFVAASVVRWNGLDRSTVLVSNTEVRALIPASDLATAGVAQISVFSPSPGGGESEAKAFPIVAPPVLSVSATTVAAGASVTMTLTNGPGGLYDWLSFAATGAADNAYVKWTYVGGGVTTRTWTVTMPTTPGTYEFRLFPNNSYTRAATSPVITVEAPPPPVLSVSATAVVGGSSVTMTLNDGLGGAYDWLTLAAAGAAETSYVQWVYVGAGVTNRTWTVTMPTAPGAYEFRLYPNNGYTRAATSPTVLVSAPPPPPTPELTVSATSVQAGASVTMTLSNGSGGVNDWLVLAATSAANTSYLQWTYVGTGVSNRDWTVTMPSTPGTYEFRLFLNNGYVRAATSATVTVVPPPPPVLSVDATSVSVGDSVTMTLTNGTGGLYDWLAVAPAGAANTSYVQWIHVGSGVTTRTWTVTLPAGTYEFRLFLNNGYTRAATSPVFTVSGSPPD